MGSDSRPKPDTLKLSKKQHTCFDFTLYMIGGSQAQWTWRGEQTGGRKREALRFQPRLHVFILSCDPSLHPWRLLRAGCKDLTENKVWRVLKDTFIWEKQYAGKDINYLSHTVHLPGHGGLNCTHTALNAKKCSIWRHKFKPKLPFRSLTYCSVLWDSQVLRISQTTIVTEGMATTWSSWKTD